MNFATKSFARILRQVGFCPSERCWDGATVKVMNILNWEPPFGEKGVEVGGHWATWQRGVSSFHRFFLSLCLAGWFFQINSCNLPWDLYIHRSPTKTNTSKQWCENSQNFEAATPVKLDNIPGSSKCLEFQPFQPKRSPTKRQKWYICKGRSR